MNLRPKYLNGEACINFKNGKVVFTAIDKNGVEYTVDMYGITHKIFINGNWKELYDKFDNIKIFNGQRTDCTERFAITYDYGNDEIVFVERKKDDPYVFRACPYGNGYCTIVDEENNCDSCSLNEGYQGYDIRLCGQQHCWYGCVCCEYNHYIYQEPFDDLRSE